MYLSSYTDLDHILCLASVAVNIQKRLCTDKVQPSPIALFRSVSRACKQSCWGLQKLLLLLKRAQSAAHAHMLL